MLKSLKDQPMLFNHANKFKRTTNDSLIIALVVVVIIIIITISVSIKCQMSAIFFFSILKSKFFKSVCYFVLYCSIYPRISFCIRMAEAKSYAQRNREGSDWFSHDDNAAKNSPQHKAAESDNEVTEDKNGEMEPNSPRTQLIKPVCNSNQWYKHDGKEETDEVTPSGGGKEKMHMPRQSGGDWYSHEEKNAEKAADVKVRVGST